MSQVRRSQCIVQGSYVYILGYWYWGCYVYIQGSLTDEKVPEYSTGALSIHLGHKSGGKVHEYSTGFEYIYIGTQHYSLGPSPQTSGPRRVHRTQVLFSGTFPTDIESRIYTFDHRTLL